MSLMMTWFFGIFYFAVQSRDNLLVRPHPFVWRMVHGQAVLYSMLLVAMATQDAEDVRSVVKWMQFDDLREELPDASKDYAADCRLFTAELVAESGNWRDALKPLTDRIDAGLTYRFYNAEDVQLVDLLVLTCVWYVVRL